MKVFVSHEDDTVEIKVPGRYSPDILSDMTHRASELLMQQRMAGELLEAVEDSDPPS